MRKLTRETLTKLRAELKPGMAMRDPIGKDTQIIVGMGTCGISAGAKDVFNACVEELVKLDITNVLVRQDGCMKLCQHEPTVEIIVPGMQTVVYGKVTPKFVQEIIQQHVINHTVIEDKVCSKPDIK